MTTSPRILISGAGLVGSLLAYTLKKKGCSVCLFEKRPDLRTSPQGSGRSINLVITSRGLHALEKVGLAQAALDHTVPVRGRMVHPLDGPPRYHPYGREGECNLAVSRLSLNRLLLDRVIDERVDIFFETELESLDLQNQKALLKKGPTYDWDLFFGCDGAASATRRILALNGETTVDTESLGVDYKELFMPSGSGLIKEALHIWPRGRHMLMGLPNQDGSFTMTLYLPEKGGISFEQLSTKDRLTEYFQTNFADAVPLMPTLATDFFINPQSKLGTIRCSKWQARGKVALLGDAAHTIVPFFGQGMNAGFEDITTLMALEDRHKKNWSKVLEDYDHLQRPNGEAIATMAMENFVEMIDTVSHPEFVLRKQVEAKIEEAFPNRYRSRYGLVTYTLVPYKEVQKIGRIQKGLLDELCAPLKSPQELDLSKAEKLITEKLPFLKDYLCGG